MVRTLCVSVAKQKNGAAARWGPPPGLPGLKPCGDLGQIGGCPWPRSDHTSHGRLRASQRKLWLSGALTRRMVTNVPRSVRSLVQAIRRGLACECRMNPTDHVDSGRRSEE